MHLEDKVVIVTGAAQGIGKAYARAILDEGGTVVAGDIDAERLAALKDEVGDQADRLSVVTNDITSWDAAGELVAGAVETFGRLDGLVNNAGLYDVRRAEENDEASIRSQVEVNMLGTMFCGVHALRVMLDQGHGSLINITSGAMAGLPLRGIYSATKAGATALTWSWAQDVAGTGVRVNAVSPLARTRQLDAAANYLKVDHDTLLRNIPPEINACVVTYLLSDAASDLNGQTVRISDDVLTLIGKPDIHRPVITLTEHTYDEVKIAFDTNLREHLTVVGAPNWSPVGKQGDLAPQAGKK